MRLLALLIALVPVCTHAQEALPTSYKLVYEVDNLDGAAVKTNRLEASYQDGKPRLVLDLVERGEKKHVEHPSWPLAEAAAVWREVETAKLCDWKPQQGDATPHFSPVRLSLEAKTSTQARACAHAWTSPLKNDGSIWALKDMLDRMMANPPVPPSPAASPASPSPSPEASK